MAYLKMARQAVDCVRRLGHISLNRPEDLKQRGVNTRRGYLLEALNFEEFRKLLRAQGDNFVEGPFRNHAKVMKIGKIVTFMGVGNCGEMSAVAYRNGVRHK